MKKHILFLTLLLASAATLTAQSNLTFKFDILGHAEIRKGGLKDSSNYDPRFLVNRNRLIADYFGTSGKMRWDFHLTLQHKTIWGQTGSLKIFEGWGKLSGENGLFLQVGRQALSYDDERIIGMNDWAMASQSHDVVRAGYEGNIHKLHLAAAYNQDGDVEETGGSFFDAANGAQVYKTMLMGWYHIQPKDFPASLSLLFMNIGMQAGKKGIDEHNEYQNLIGGYAKFEKPWLTVEGEYYYQGGHEEHGLPIDAWMAAVKASWHPVDLLDFIAGYDYLSGDELFNVPPEGTLGMIQHKVIKGFNPIWGSHHKFYGAMDFFYVSTYFNGFTPGLRNLYATVELHPTEKLDFGLGYHYLATATKLSGMDLTLGHEIELSASYNITKEVSLSAGFSYMTGDETMNKLKRSSDDSHLSWAWIDLRFKN